MEPRAYRYRPSNLPPALRPPEFRLPAQRDELPCLAADAVCLPGVPQCATSCVQEGDQAEIRNEGS
jgi:hypothetical protein